jgi:TfoX/Sxy family transcriptional regulator of competence genes
MSVMQPGAMPKPTEEGKAAFRSVLPDDPAVTVRPMFGNVAAFCNGNMFAGLFGEDLFVRLGEEERTRLLKLGGTVFEPMPGRAMKDYVTVPGKWATDLDGTRQWIATSLASARTLPPKKPAGKK